MSDSKQRTSGTNNHQGGFNKSRRSFIKKITAGTAFLSGANFMPLYLQRFSNENPAGKSPWYKNVKRWGQINITVDTADNFDINWWREYWKKTGTQGIVLNAGGIVAYYPTQVPYHYKAPLLGDRDLFGDLCNAAHEDGLAVFARLDSCYVHEDMYQAHPDWCAVRANGEPYAWGDLYATCVNTPYYTEHIPAVIREIIDRYHPEGITDNNWDGITRASICYCKHCKRKYMERTGMDLPVKPDWDDMAYRKWVEWGFERRVELWGLNNQVTRSAGGEDCAWAGMITCSITSQAKRFHDLRGIAKHAKILMIDMQGREEEDGLSSTFQQNAENGKLVHSVIGWDMITAQSMALWGRGNYKFRLASKSPAEAHMWMLEGFAGGIAPWWHNISGYHEDRRRYYIVEPVYDWHEANEQFLFNRKPVATVGILWSQENTLWYGRDEADVLVDLPMRGIIHALVRSRIPYVFVNADRVEQDTDQLSLLILPDFGTITDPQLAAIRKYVTKGGNLLATGNSSLYDEYGDRRKDYALADLFGAHFEDSSFSGSGDPLREKADRSSHTYMRIYPELRGTVEGPSNGEEPPVTGERHPVFRGFEKTDILSFGGTVSSVRAAEGTEVPMTFIPEFPAQPPEDCWMRVPETNIPCLILNTLPGGNRIAFMPADIDRRFAMYNLPDHANLLSNLVRWTIKNDIPLEVKGPGLIDCNLYHQPGRLILHMANLTSSGTWRQPIDEYIPVGPFSVRIKLPADVKSNKPELRVSGQQVWGKVSDGWVHFEVDSISDHEMVVI